MVIFHSYVSLPEGMSPPLFRPGHERKISTDFFKRPFEHAVDFTRLRVRLRLIPVAQTGPAIVLDKMTKIPWGFPSFPSSNMAGKSQHNKDKSYGKYGKIPHQCMCFPAGHVWVPEAFPEIPHFLLGIHSMHWLSNLMLECLATQSKGADPVETKNPGATELDTKLSGRKTMFTHHFLVGLWFWPLLIHPNGSNMGPELFCFFSVLFFLGGGIYFSARFPGYLQHFATGNCHFNSLCNILELEPLIFHSICRILVEFVTFWSWKLPFQRYLQHFWVRTFHFRWNLQLFVARTVHVTW